MLSNENGPQSSYMGSPDIARTHSKRASHVDLNHSGVETKNTFKSYHSQITAKLSRRMTLVSKKSYADNVNASKFRYPTHSNTFLQIGNLSPQRLDRTQRTDVQESITDRKSTKTQVRNIGSLDLCASDNKLRIHQSDKKYQKRIQSIENMD